MTSKNAVFLWILIGALGLFTYSVRRLILHLQVGKSDDRFDNPLRRIKNVIVVAFGQSKLLREPVAGLMHFFIYWGFVVLVFAVLESMAEGVIPRFTMEFLGNAYLLVLHTEEAFAALVAISVLVALFRRFVTRPKRLEVDFHGKLDATLILVMIFIIVTTMLGQNATRAMLHG
ncbi:MAG: Fe-S oxidoreductase, partial [Bacteroidota bacterium]